ncbi:MAG: DUF4129 domain-containing protein [Streptosporangiaceae bacterium]
MPGFQSAQSALAGPVTTVGGPYIGRLPAQRLARRELAEVSFWQRVLDWLARTLGSASHSVPGGWFGLIVLLVLAVAGCTLIITRFRPGAGSRLRSAPVLAGESRTAADHRRSAMQHAAAGDYTAAIIDGLRSIAADLDERTVLPPDPGRTADELAAQAGLLLPGRAGDLIGIARLFDDVRYGGQRGTAQGYASVMEVAGELRSVRAAAPAPAGPSASEIGLPR